MNATAPTAKITRTAATAPITADKLIEKMAIAAAEIYMLGADEDDSDAGAIKDAILLIEKAWGLTGGQAEHAIALIAGQFKLINQKIKTDETIFKIVLDRKLLINYPSSAERLAVLRTLLETIVRLDLQDDREKIVSLMDFLSGFWNIDERVLW